MREGAVLQAKPTSSQYVAMLTLDNGWIQPRWRRFKGAPGFEVAAKAMRKEPDRVGTGSLLLHLHGCRQYHSAQQLNQGLNR